MNIEELAEQVGLKRRTDVFFSEFCDGVFGGDLERLAELVAAHEREECAKICDEHYDAMYCGDAIRARSKA
jgi:hypothetical protein